MNPYTILKYNSRKQPIKILAKLQKSKHMGVFIHHCENENIFTDNENAWVNVGQIIYGTKITDGY